MSNQYSFVGGNQGLWRVTEVRGISGPGLELVERLDVVKSDITEAPLASAWGLRSFSSNIRYAKRVDLSPLPIDSNSSSRCQRHREHRAPARRSRCLALLRCQERH